MQTKDSRILLLISTLSFLFPYIALANAGTVTVQGEVYELIADDLYAGHAGHYFYLEDEVRKTFHEIKFPNNIKPNLRPGRFQIQGRMVGGDIVVDQENRRKIKRLARKPKTNKSSTTSTLPNRTINSNTKAQPFMSSTAMAALPLLHSKPNARIKIFLDFDGHLQARWGNRTNLTTPPYDIDGDTTNFSTEELNRIQGIWQRVAEDFSPFNIDVTTEEPPNNSPGEMIRVAIGGSSSDWFGSPAGGVAFIGAFNSSFNTVYVFSDDLAGGREKPVAEAASHELGHGFFLYHQSTWNGNSKIEEYNPGGGGWAPIMGVSYSQNQTTWHNGRNSNGDTQDDLAIIAGNTNGFGYGDDDHGDNNATATMLIPVNTTITAQGIIEQVDDRDVIGFSTDSGSIALTVEPNTPGPNMDVRLELYDSLGQLRSISDPNNDLGAEINLTVTAGTYFLHILSDAEYGEVGQFTFSGNIIPIQGLLEQPMNLVGVLNNAEITLTWEDRSSTEDGFHIEREYNAEGWIQIASITANMTTFTDTNTNLAGNYKYRVRAFNDVTTSVYSNEVTVTVAAQNNSGGGSSGNLPPSVPPPMVNTDTPVMPNATDATANTTTDSGGGGGSANLWLLVLGLLWYVSMLRVRTS